MSAHAQKPISGRQAALLNRTPKQADIFDNNTSSCICSANSHVSRASIARLYSLTQRTCERPCERSSAIDRHMSATSRSFPTWMAPSQSLDLSQSIPGWLPVNPWIAPSQSLDCSQSIPGLLPVNPWISPSQSLDCSQVKPERVTIRL